MPRSMMSDDSGAIARLSRVYRAGAAVRVGSLTYTSQCFPALSVADIRQFSPVSTCQGEGRGFESRRPLQKRAPRGLPAPFRVITKQRMGDIGGAHGVGAVLDGGEQAIDFASTGLLVSESAEWIRSFPSYYPLSKRWHRYGVPARGTIGLPATCHCPESTRSRPARHPRP